jgi:hypothetical protein
MLLLVHMLVAADQGVLVLQLLSMLVAAGQPRCIFFLQAAKLASTGFTYFFPQCLAGIFSTTKGVC